MKHACQRHGIGWHTAAWLTQSLTVQGQPETVPHATQACNNPHVAVTD